MKQIVLNNGFAVEVDENVIDNMELVDALAEMKDDDDPLGISKVTKLLLGKKQRKPCMIQSGRRTAECR